MLTRKKIIEFILAEYKNDIMLWSSPGRANLLTFNSAANEKLRIQDLHDEDEVHVHSGAKSIVTDITGIHLIRTYTRQKFILFHLNKM